MNKQAKRSRWILAAVLASMPATLASVNAQAQQQQAQTGRALDANNRIGSGGTNTYRPPPSAGVYGNNIVNGTIGGGKQFHGATGSVDATSFRGFAPGTSTDNFIRDSAQVGVGNTPAPIPGVPTPYYGASRFSAPSQPGFVQNPTGPGYVPAEPNYVQAHDLRLGAQLDAIPTNQVPRAGELLLPGPVDPTSNQQTSLSASPLTGIRQLNPSDATDASFLRRFTGTRQDNLFERIQMNTSDVQRMREELRTAPGLKGAGAESNGPLKGAGTTPPINQAIGQPLEAPATPSIGNKPMVSLVESNPLNGSATSEQGQFNRLVGSPAQQSDQYNEMKKRLERYQTEHKTATQIAADQFNNAVKAKKDAEAKAAAIAGKKPADMPKTPTEDKPPTGTKPEAKPDPVSVKSMTSGVNGKGLKEMLGKAETLMKDGKYTSAIDQYAAAEQVAPNQPLIWIGRANAELGASYYNRAEAHLKDAFKSDQALLMAQYDLRSFLGEERMLSVIKDLKEIASADQKSPTPVFLLAYIAYNTGNERKAAGYLDLAEKRTDGKDPIYKLLREHWALPIGDAPGEPKGAEPNK